MNEIKISTKQFICIVVLYTIGTTILITPAGLADVAKQDAWMIPLIGMCIGVPFIWLYTTLGSLYPNKTFAQIIEILLGKWVGKAVSLTYVILAFIGAEGVVWIEGNFIVTQLMPETPILFINILVSFVVIYSITSGIETIARCAEILLPIIIILFFVIITFASHSAKLQNIQPIFDNGIKPIIRATLNHLSIQTLPLIILLSVSPSCINNLSKFKKSFYTGYIIGGFITFISTLLCILALGTTITSNANFPVYLLAQKVGLIGITGRAQTLVAIIWILTIFLKTVFYLYAAIDGITKIFNLKDYRYITPPIGVAMALLSSTAYRNIMYEAKWDSTTWVSYIYTYAFFLPVLLLIIAFFKKKAKHKSN